MIKVEIYENRHKFYLTSTLDLFHNCPSSKYMYNQGNSDLDYEQCALKYESLMLDNK